jgi:hypothetical protein
MLRLLKPMRENAKIAHALLLSKARESINVYLSSLDVETIRPLYRQPEVVDQIKPHKLADRAKDSISASWKLDFFFGL